MIINVQENCNHQDQDTVAHSNTGPTDDTPRPLSRYSWCGSSTSHPLVRVPLSSRRKSCTHRGSGTEPGSQTRWLFPLSPAGHRHHRGSQGRNNHHSHWNHCHTRQDQENYHQTRSGILVLEVLVVVLCPVLVGGRGSGEVAVVGTRESLRHGTHGWWFSHSLCI